MSQLGELASNIVNEMTDYCQREMKEGGELDPTDPVVLTFRFWRQYGQTTKQITLILCRLSQGREEYLNNDQGENRIYYDFVDNINFLNSIREGYMTPLTRTSFHTSNDNDDIEIVEEASRLMYFNRRLDKYIHWIGMLIYYMRHEPARFRLLYEAVLTGEEKEEFPLPPGQENTVVVNGLNFTHETISRFDSVADKIIRMAVVLKNYNNCYIKKMEHWIRVISETDSESD